MSASNAGCHTSPIERRDVRRTGNIGKPNLKTFKILLAAVLTLSLFLHLVTLWRERDNIAAAYGDFIIFYTASKIVLDGRAEHLYDLTVQKSYQATFNVPFRPDPLPYNHPAYELLLVLPLARLSYTGAFIAWGVFNICLVVGIVWLLSSTISRENRRLAALLCGAFFPVTAALWQGQDSILSAFLVSAAFISLRRGHEGLAGAALALGLYKPQLVLPIAAILALQRRWTAVFSFAIVGVILAGASILITGWSGAVDYVRLLTWIDKTHYTIDPANMANLRGLFENASSFGIPRVVTLLITAAASLSMVSWSLLQWKANEPVRGRSFNLVFSHLIITTLLVSYHLYIHDLTLLVIPLVTLLDYGMTDAHAAPMARNTVLATLIILSVPLVSLLLPLRLMSWMAVGLLIIADMMSYGLRQLAIAQR
jgi:hypothetical protein